MVLLTSTTLREFWRTHPDAEPSLRNWVRVVAGSDRPNVREACRFFPPADGVTADDGRTLTVFNVGGNRYRLVVEIVYATRTIYVVGIMTHAEYNRGRWKR